MQNLVCKSTIDLLFYAQQFYVSSIFVLLLNVLFTHSCFVLHLNANDVFFELRFCCLSKCKGVVLSIHYFKIHGGALELESSHFRNISTTPLTIKIQIWDESLTHFKSSRKALIKEAISTCEALMDNQTQAFTIHFSRSATYFYEFYLNWQTNHIRQM